MLKDHKITAEGIFNIKVVDAITGKVLEEYEEKNLIMDKARQNMARLVGGVDDVDGTRGHVIDRLVIGTQGHSGGNIITPIQVGSEGFDSTRDKLFSEENGGFNYHLKFDATGNNIITVVGDGSTYNGTKLLMANESSANVKRVVAGEYGRTLTYTFEIPPTAANGDGVVAYTEAALYTNKDIFSMKTFPARIKEETVKFIISWSIIF